MTLIKSACQVICSQANAFLGNIERRPDPWVVLTSLVNHDGSMNEAARDSVVMTVYNITRESFASSYQPASPMQPGAPASGLAVVNPPLYIDLHIMFMANFTEKTYVEGLSALSQVISCFQMTPYLTAQNTPGLPPQITKLSMELENLSITDVNYVMGVLGTKYLPSVFYKVRMLPFASQAMVARTYPVTAPEAGQTPEAS